MPAQKMNAKVISLRTVLFRSALGWILAALLGSSGILLIRIPNFPNILAAQITAGMIGLAGGFSYALLARATGLAVGGGCFIFLAFIWALSCVLGITPLFHASGSPLMMTGMLFYSFAVSGGFGSLATVLIIRSRSAGASASDCIHAVAIWSFSFGLAALASNLVGEGMAVVMPPWLAWPLGFVAMAVIIGIGGGYALRGLQRARKIAGPAAQEMPGPWAAGEGDNLYPIILILLLLPFYLNDFADIYVKDWRVWLAIDYLAVKLFPFLVLFSVVGAGKISLVELGLRKASVTSSLVVLYLGALAGIFFEQQGYQILNLLSGYPPLGKMPAITSPFWHWFDLTAGLLMVGVFEELVFRGYLRAFLSRYTERSSLIIGASALAFGLIHWSGGLDKVIATSVVGAVYMILYLKTSNLPALMLAHFIVNFADFTNLIPKFVLRFY